MSTTEWSIFWPSPHLNNPQKRPEQPNTQAEKTGVALLADLQTKGPADDDSAEVALGVYTSQYKKRKTGNIQKNKYTISNKKCLHPFYVHFASLSS